MARATARSKARGRAKIRARARAGVDKIREVFSALAIGKGFLDPLHREQISTIVSAKERVSLHSAFYERRVSLLSPQNSVLSSAQIREDLSMLSLWLGERERERERERDDLLSQERKGALHSLRKKRVSSIVLVVQKMGSIYPFSILMPST